MADGTKIEWTDATWNPITGCSVVSPGCTNCYAMKLAGTRLKHIPSRAGLTRETKAGPVWNGEVRLNEEMLDQPLRWRRPRMIFVCAHGDLFAEGVPDEWIDRVFAVMALAPQHTFQVLTKRAERMRDYLRDKNAVRRIYAAADTLRWSVAPDPDRRPRDFNRWMNASAKDVAWLTEGGCAEGLFRATEPNRAYPSWVRWPLPNAWLGVSAEDQKRADERVPLLLDTPAAVRWVSAEPLLGPIDFTFFRQPNMGGGPWWFDALDRRRAGWFADEAATIPTDDPHDHDPYVPRLDWIVAGGESGAGARPMHPEWVRAIRDQCAAVGVAFLFKQWGTWKNGSDFATDAMAVAIDGRVIEPTREAMQEADRADPVRRAAMMRRVGKKAAGRDLDGVTHDALPTGGSA